MTSQRELRHDVTGQPELQDDPRQRPAAEIISLIKEFAEMTPPLRLERLVEASDELACAPAELREQLELVSECQAPVAIGTVVGSDPQQRTQVYVSAPQHAPTSRGFAALVQQACADAPAANILSIPNDFPEQLGLVGVVSPLRISGMRGLVRRLKEQVRQQLNESQQ